MRTLAASVGLRRRRGRRRHRRLLVGLWTPRGGGSIHRLGGRGGVGGGRRCLEHREGSWENRRRRGNESVGQGWRIGWIAVAAADAAAENAAVVVGSGRTVGWGWGCMRYSAGRGLIGTRYAMRRLLPALVKPTRPGECCVVVLAG